MNFLPQIFLWGRKITKFLPTTNEPIKKKQLPDLAALKQKLRTEQLTSEKQKKEKVTHTEIIEVQESMSQSEGGDMREKGEEEQQVEQNKTQTEM